MSELASQLRETYEPVHKHLDYQASKRDASTRAKSSPPMKMLLHALNDIQRFDPEFVFAQPPSRDIPRYYDIVKTPMDLSTWLCVQSTHFFSCFYHISKINVRMHTQLHNDKQVHFKVIPTLVV